MIADEMSQLLVDIFRVDPQETEQYIFLVRNLKVLKLRDILVQIGHISHENLDKQEYVMTMGAGFMKSNTAYLALRIDDGRLYISVYAKEGLINQHTCKGAINEIKKSLGEYFEGEQ